MTKKRAQYINSIHICSTVPLQYVLLMLKGRSVKCLIPICVYCMAAFYKTLMYSYVVVMVSTCMNDVLVN